MNETSSIIRAFMALKAENRLLAQQLEAYKRQHDELYAAMISFLMQSGREMRLKKENVVPLVLSDYRIETLDCGEEIVYKLEYVCDPT